MDANVISRNQIVKNIGTIKSGVADPNSGLFGPNSKFWKVNGSSHLVSAPLLSR